MSARQVLALVDELLKDQAEGFEVTLAALIAADPPALPLRAETDVSRLRPASTVMRPTTTPRISAHLRAATATTIQPLQRDGKVTIDLHYETFEADEEVLEMQVAYAASAAAKVMLDHLREYSDAHGGTVVEVDDEIGFTFGQFDGPVSAGFIASVKITERSSE